MLDVKRTPMVSEGSWADVANVGGPKSKLQFVVASNHLMQQVTRKTTSSTTNTTHFLPHNYHPPWLPLQSPKQTQRPTSACNPTNRYTSKTCPRNSKNPTSSALCTCSSQPSARYWMSQQSNRAKCVDRRMCCSAMCTPRHRQ